MKATFDGNRRESGIHTGSHCHITSRSATKWRLKRISLPHYIEISNKVAIKEDLTVTIHRNQHESGVYPAHEAILHQQHHYIILITHSRSY